MQYTNIWEQIMAFKKKDTRHKGIANDLADPEIETILATADFWGEPVKPIVFDLKVARYRIFDWLAMGVHGRIQSDEASKVFAFSFIKSEGDVNKFIDDLRYTDYDIDREWERIDLEQDK